MDRLALVALVALAALGACGANSPTPDLGDVYGIDELWRGTPLTEDVPQRTRMFSATEFGRWSWVRACGCRVDIGVSVFPGTRRMQVIDLGVHQCQRDEAVHITSRILDSYVFQSSLGDAGRDALLDQVFRSRRPFHRTYGNATADVTWAQDVYIVDGHREPQSTTSYRIVMHPKDGSPDRYLAPVEPTVTELPRCDPRSSEDMASIPTGPAISTLTCAPESTTLAFAVDRHRVSCDDYQACVDAGGCRDHWNCMLKMARATLEDASTFCRWRKAVLPSMAQLQRAIRGPDGNVFPTGKTWDPAAGCRKPYLPSSLTHEPPAICEHTNADGVVYYVLDRADEWTRDTDCYSTEAPDARHAIALGARDRRLDRRIWYDNPSKKAGAYFRCVR